MPFHHHHGCFGETIALLLRGLIAKNFAAIAGRGLAEQNPRYRFDPNHPDR
jgi:hypothetical protein